MNVLYKTKEFNACVIRKISKSCTNNIITPVQAQIIDYMIKNNNYVYQKDIEKILHFRRSTISGILHTMEKNELIKKQNMDKDARVKMIVLTKKAINLHNEIVEKFNKLNKEICKNIKDEELSIFLNTLDKMIDNIRKDD